VSASSRRLAAALRRREGRVEHVQPCRPFAEDVVEMLVSDVPERVYKPDSELALWRRWLNIGRPAGSRRAISRLPICRIRRWR